MHRSGSSGRGIPQPYAFRGEDMPRKPLEGCLRPAMRGIARWQRAAGFPGVTMSWNIKRAAPQRARMHQGAEPTVVTRQQQRAGASAQPYLEGKAPTSRGQDEMGLTFSRQCAS